jgi:1-acyl-sn-glycerol-3-phosphate acyltransferase
VPPPRRWFARWFTGHAVERLRQGFHGVRLLGPVPRVVPPETPLVVYANHASWWDPLAALGTKPILFPGRTDAYAPIDAEMLERYGIFRWLGFFGVDRDSPRGASRFLDEAADILRRPGSVLYVTPQGRFADVRERPLGFRRGIAHLALRVPEAVFLPLAMECTFWEESRPELLLHVGEPWSGAPESGAGSLERVLRDLEQGLEAAMDRLAEASVGRRREAFTVLFRGQAGVGGVYDAWRWVRAKLAGRSPRLHHGPDEGGR